MADVMTLTEGCDCTQSARTPSAVRSSARRFCSVKGTPVADAHSPMEDGASPERS